MARHDRLAEILAELGIDPSPSDPQAVARALRRAKTESAPDRRTGDFRSEEDERRFARVNEAQELLKSRREPNAVVLSRDITRALRAIAREDRSREHRDELRRDNVMAKHREVTRRRYALPRLTTGILSSVFLALLGLMKAQDESPLLAPFREALATRQHAAAVGRVEASLRAEEVGARVLGDSAAVLAPELSGDAVPWPDSAGVASMGRMGPALADLRAEMDAAASRFAAAVHAADSTAAASDEAWRRLTSPGERGAPDTAGVAARIERLEAQRDSAATRQRAAASTRDSIRDAVAALGLDVSPEERFRRRLGQLRRSLRQDSVRLLVAFTPAWEMALDSASERRDTLRPPSEDLRDEVAAVNEALRHGVSRSLIRERPHGRVALLAHDSLRGANARFRADSTRAALEMEAGMDPEAADPTGGPPLSVRLVDAGRALNAAAVDLSTIDAALERLRAQLRPAPPAGDTAAQRAFREREARAQRVARARRGYDRLGRTLAGLERTVARSQAESDRHADTRIGWTLAGLLAAAGLAWLSLWMRERSDDRWAERLLTEGGTGEVAARIAAFAERRMAAEKAAAATFSAADLHEVVAEKHPPRGLAWMVGRRMDDARVAPVASQVLERLLTRAVVRRSAGPRAVPHFEIPAPVLRDLTRGRGAAAPV
jgi:hypothetical protein